MDSKITEELSEIKELIEAFKIKKALVRIELLEKEILENKEISITNLKKVMKKIKKFQKKSEGINKIIDLHHPTPEYFKFNLSETETLKYSFNGKLCLVFRDTRKGCAKGFFVISDENLYFVSKNKGNIGFFLNNGLESNTYQKKISFLDVQGLKLWRNNVKLTLFEKDKNGNFLKDRNGDIRKFRATVIFIKNFKIPLQLTYDLAEQIHEFLNKKIEKK